MLILLDANELRALAFYLFNLGCIPATDTETETLTLSLGRASSSVRFEFGAAALRARRHSRNDAASMSRVVALIMVIDRAPCSCVHGGRLDGCLFNSHYVSIIKQK